MTEDVIYLDFSKDDVAVMEQRILQILEKHRDRAPSLRVILHEKGTAGGPIKHRDWKAGDAPNFRALAEQIASFLALYVKGQTGRLYKGATVRIF